MKELMLEINLTNVINVIKSLHITVIIKDIKELILKKNLMSVIRW